MKNHIPASRIRSMLLRANELSLNFERMDRENFILTVRPRITVKQNCIQIAFCISVLDLETGRYLDIADENNETVCVAATVTDLLEWAAVLRHQNRPPKNATYIVDGEESLLDETIGGLLEKSPVAEAIRIWWSEFTNN